MFGVPWESIMGPTLIQKCLADLFFILSDIDIADFADDNTRYNFCKNVYVIESLENFLEVFS